MEPPIKCCAYGAPSGRSCTSPQGTPGARKRAALIDGGTGLDPMKEAKGRSTGMAQRIVQASNTNGMKPNSVWNLIVERRDRCIASVGIATGLKLRLIRKLGSRLDILNPLTEQQIEGNSPLQRHVGDAPPCQCPSLQQSNNTEIHIGYILSLF